MDSYKWDVGGKEDLGKLGWRISQLGCLVSTWRLGWGILVSLFRSTCFQFSEVFNVTLLRCRMVYRMLGFWWVSILCDYMSIFVGSRIILHQVVSRMYLHQDSSGCLRVLGLLFIIKDWKETDSIPCLVAVVLECWYLYGWSISFILHSEDLCLNTRLILSLLTALLIVKIWLF